MAREIELKQCEIEKNGNKEKFDYRKQIEHILNSQTQGRGFSLGDVRICNKIQKSLDSANGSLCLEEQQYNFLKKKIEAFQWGMPHPVIEEFADAILKAEPIKD